MASSTVRKKKNKRKYSQLNQTSDLSDHQIYKKLKVENEVVLSCTDHLPLQEVGGKPGGNRPKEQVFGNNEFSTIGDRSETSVELDHEVCHFVFGQRGSCS